MGVLPDWMIERDVGIAPFARTEHRPGVVSYGTTSYGYDVRLGYKFRVFKPFPAGVIDPKAFNPQHLIDVDLTPLPHVWAEDGFCKVCQGTRFPGPDQVSDPAVCKTRHVPNFIDIPPYSFVLGESVEEFTIPRDVLVVVVGKSTYARCGLIVNVTPGEPEWRGYWTIELTNPTPLPMRVYCGEGIMQAIFLRSDGYRDLMVRVFKEWFSEPATTLTRWGSVFNSVWSTFWSKVTCTTSYKDKKGKYANQKGLTLPKVD